MGFRELIIEICSVKKKKKNKKASTKPLSHLSQYKVQKSRINNY